MTLCTARGRAPRSKGVVPYAPKNPSVTESLKLCASVLARHRYNMEKSAFFTMLLELLCFGQDNRGDSEEEMWAQHISTCSVTDKEGS